MRIYLAALFAASIAFLAVTGQISWVVPVFYLAISTVAFIVYAIDKSAARKARSRIPEKILHLLGLAGGWPGALVAQKLLRHKSVKQPFQTVFWMTVIVHCCGLAGIWIRSGAPGAG